MNKGSDSPGQRVQFGNKYELDMVGIEHVQLAGQGKENREEMWSQTLEGSGV